MGEAAAVPHDCAATQTKGLVAVHAGPVLLEAANPDGLAADNQRGAWCVLPECKQTGDDKTNTVVVGVSRAQWDGETGAARSAGSHRSHRGWWVDIDRSPPSRAESRTAIRFVTMAVYPLPGSYEPVNSILHLGAAGVVAILGVRLIRRNRGDGLRVSLLSVFVFACLFMLSMSGVYHLLTRGGAGSAVLFRLDKASIFVLIAGTFTPVHGLLFRGAVRWAGLGLMWAAAGTGVTLMTVFFNSVPYGLGTTLYLALGWIASISVIALWRRRGFRYVRLIIAGGVAYSVGAIVNGIRWPTLIPGVFGPHELWHVAVLTGLGLHWRFVSRIARDDRYS
jgi:hemolysin III